MGARGKNRTMLALNEAVQRIGHADTAMLVIRLLRAEKASLDVSDATWHPTDDLVSATSFCIVRI